MFRLKSPDKSIQFTDAEAYLPLDHVPLLYEVEINAD